MAKEAPNNYLGSMCVRNAVLSAWTTLEMACCDALGIQKLQSDFRRSLDAEFAGKGLTPLDFGSGLWQKINTLIKGYRTTFAHAGVDIKDRFPPVLVAVEAVETIRQAIHDIYAKTGKSSPPWVDLNQSDGWPQTRGGGMQAHLTVLEGPIDKGAPNVFKISLVTPAGDEKETRWLPENTPMDEIMDRVEQILGGLNVPFKGIRVYRGQDLLVDENFEMR
jgi:hypothetical protein